MQGRSSTREKVRRSLWRWVSKPRHLVFVTVAGTAPVTRHAAGVTSALAGHSPFDAPASSRSLPPMSTLIHCSPSVDLGTPTLPMRGPITGRHLIAGRPVTAPPNGALAGTSWRADGGTQMKGPFNGRALPALRFARAERGLKRIGLVGGENGTDLVSEVDNKADLLLRSLPVEVGSVPRVRLSRVSWKLRWRSPA
jgi:hypothetical protein